jgi:outer membrane lipoprotein-sorting protein
MRHPLLARAIQAEATLTYSGRRTVEFRVGAERVRHVEIVLRNGWQSRTEFEPGTPNAGQIIVENRERRWHFFPETNEIHVLPPRRDGVLLRLGQMLRARIRIEESPGGEVAGLRTRQLAFVDPRGNVIQRLWIHPPSAMVVRRELFDLVGTRIGAFEFTRVNFQPSFAPEDFRILRQGATMVTLPEQIRRVARRLGLQPHRLPEAEPYSLEAVRPMNLAGRRLMAQMYIGERGRLTLFQVAGELDGDLVRQLARPGLGSRTWRRQGATFLLVGDVGQAELDRLAERMR